MAPLYGWSLTVSRLHSHYDETVNFLTLGHQDFLVLIQLTLEGNLEPPSGFKPRIPGLGIKHINHQANCSFRLTHLFFIYEQTLFNFSNIQLEQQIHFLHNPFFIHPAIQNATPLFEQLSKTSLWFFLFMCRPWGQI